MYGKTLADKALLIKDLELSKPKTAVTTWRMEAVPGVCGLWVSAGSARCLAGILTGMREGNNISIISRTRTHWNRAMEHRGRMLGIPSAKLSKNIYKIRNQTSSSFLSFKPLFLNKSHLVQKESKLQIKPHLKTIQQLLHHQNNNN